MLVKNPSLVGSRVIDLNDPDAVHLLNGWQMEDAYAVNTSGDVAGYATKQGVKSAFFLKRRSPAN